MKVLHVYKTYFPDSVGGVEQVIKEIIVSTQNLGIESSVLSLSAKKVERTVQVNGHDVHRCRSNIDIASTPLSISAFKRFSGLAKNADIIHYHYPWPFADVMHLLCRIKKPTVLTYHSDIIKQQHLLKLYKPLQKRFLSSIDVIVATSPNYVATSSTLKPYVDKTQIIPIGLDKHYYPEPDEKLLTKWRSLFPGKFFLFIGVFRYYKGLHVLIDAAKNVDCPIVIVGSGPLESELKARVAALGLSNIHFLGKVDHEDKVALLRLCYALAFPSHLRSEAFGISLLEAAMFAKPMISCEIGTGTTFVNIDKETGVVIPPNDAVALGQAMNFLLNNPEQARVLGEQAQQRYWDNFTAEKMGKAYADIYRSLISL